MIDSEKARVLFSNSSWKDLAALEQKGDLITKGEVKRVPGIRNGGVVLRRPVFRDH